MKWNKQSEASIDWLQQGSKPAFPDVIWSLPQTKLRRGSVTLIGGSGQNFGHVGQAFAELERSGIGYINLVIPDSLRKVIPSSPRTHFVASTKTNMIAKEAAGEIKRHVEAADAGLICGDLGRSSQTSHALSALFISTKRPLVVTRDAVTLLSNEPHMLLNRSDTILVATFGDLQRMFNRANSQAITSTMGVVLLIRTIKQLRLQCDIVVLYQGSIIVVSQGQASTTHWRSDDRSWRITLASYATTLIVQHPTNRFEALTTAAHLAQQTSK